MNKQINKDIKRYFKEIKANIICDFRTKRKFISDIKSAVYDYAEAENAEDMNQIYNQFGTPQDIAKEFFLHADVKRIKRRMNITKVVFAGVVIALLMFAVTLAASFIDVYRSNRGYIVDEIGTPIYSQIYFIGMGDLL